MLSGGVLKSFPILHHHPAKKLKQRSARTTKCFQRLSPNIVMRMRSYPNGALDLDLWQEWIPCCTGFALEQSKHHKEYVSLRSFQVPGGYHMVLIWCIRVIYFNFRQLNFEQRKRRRKRSESGEMREEIKSFDLSRSI